MMIWWWCGDDMMMIYDDYMMIETLVTLGWRLGFSALLCVCPTITWSLLLLLPAPLQHCLQDHTVQHGRSTNTAQWRSTSSSTNHHHHHNALSLSWSKYSCKWQDGGEGLRVRHMSDGQTIHTIHTIVTFTIFIFINIFITTFWSPSTLKCGTSLLWECSEGRCRAKSVTFISLTAVKPPLLVCSLFATLHL